MSEIDPRHPIAEDPALAPTGEAAQKPWFRQRFNMGLGVPQTWQGWLIAVLLVAAIVLIGLALKGRL